MLHLREHPHFSALIWQPWLLAHGKAHWNMPWCSSMHCCLGLVLTIPSMACTFKQTPFM